MTSIIHGVYWLTLLTILWNRDTKGADKYKKLEVMNVYGIYQHTPGTPIDAGKFLVENTRAIVERMSFPSDKIHVECSNVFENWMVIGGCQSRPLLRGNEPVHPECHMVLAYNANVLRASTERLSKLHRSDGPALCFLWSVIAIGCRMFVIDHFEVPDSALLPIRLLERFNISSASLVSGYGKGGEAHETKREADTLFLNLYTARLIKRCCMKREVCPNVVSALARIVTVRQSNWESILDQTLTS